MSEVVCFSCRTKIHFPANIGRREECSKCRADVHVCKNCIHYDKKAYNECREPAADAVTEKERANFCDFFSPHAEGPKEDSGKVDLKAAAEALFKKL